MRREELYLPDIVEGAGHIAQFIAGLDRPGFQKSELVRSAVVQKIGVDQRGGSPYLRRTQRLPAELPRS